MTDKKYQCPCCGYYTLSELDAWEICEVCFWEENVFQQNNPNDEDGPNTVSLNQAKENFKKFGACQESMISNCRALHEDEKPENN